MMRKETNQTAKRRERLLFDIASFVVSRAKYYANKNFIGRGPGATARTKGRSGALRRSIEMARVNDSHFVVTAGGTGVPYARVHEFGTAGAGGELPTIRPKPPRKWLTIPMEGKYVGRRATEFSDLHFVPTKKKKIAFLIDETGSRAYMLVKRVDIPPRPYLEPAANDAGQEARFINRLKILYGASTIPYEVTML